MMCLENMKKKKKKKEGVGKKTTRETTHFMVLAHCISYSYSLSLCDP